MPIYDNTLDYIFTDDIMLEHGWDGHPMRVRKRAQKELLKLKKENELSKEDAERLYILLLQVHTFSDDDKIVLDKAAKKHESLVKKYNDKTI